MDGNNPSDIDCLGAAYSKKLSLLESKVFDGLISAHSALPLLLKMNQYMYWRQCQNQFIIYYSTTKLTLSTRPSSSKAKSW